MIYDLHVQKEVRKWEKLYWAIDLHDTVITGKYNKFNQGSELLPGAKKVLDYLYDHGSHKTILWTSSYKEAALDTCRRFHVKFHYFNENPECPSTELCDFGSKVYFNVLLDDKAGFDAINGDWFEIYDALVENR
jgi:hypothetical protein